MKCRICPNFFFLSWKDIAVWHRIRQWKQQEDKQNTSDGKELSSFMLTCFKRPATTWMIPAYSGNTLKGQRLRVLQVHTVPAQPSAQNSLQAASASSDPGTLDNNGPSHHIIYSPVVLEEQKCDEGWEKEGNGKVLVQGSDSWSVEGDGDSGYNREANWVKSKKRTYLRR